MPHRILAVRPQVYASKPLRPSLSLPWPLTLSPLPIYLRLPVLLGFFLISLSSLSHFLPVAPQPVLHRRCQVLAQQAAQPLRQVEATGANRTALFRQVFQTTTNHLYTASPHSELTDHRSELSKVRVHPWVWGMTYILQINSDGQF